MSENIGDTKLIVCLKLLLVASSFVTGTKLNFEGCRCNNRNDVRRGSELPQECLWLTRDVSQS